MFADDFDPQKSDNTKRERGIDFIEARAIWSDLNALTVEAKTVEGEMRSATIGMIKGKLWVAIWTEVASKIRIISVRRAEKTKFERAYNEQG